MFSPFTISAPSSYRLTSFAKQFVQMHHNVSIVLPSCDRHSNFLLEENTNIGEIRLIRPRIFNFTEMHMNMIQYSLASVLKSFSLNYDVIHVLKPNILNLSGYLTKLLHGTPLIQDIDDIDHLAMLAENHPQWRVSITKHFEEFLPKFANKLVTSSSMLEKKYCYLDYGKDNITWIPNGVDTSEFNFKPDPSLKEQLHLRDKVIVYVGSLNNASQVDLLLKAMKPVSKEKRDTSCLIIGDGTAKKQLQLLTRRLNLEDCVIFLGRIPHIEVTKLLSISDIGFACFRRTDALAGASNLKVFEYMASGLSIIVSPVGDLPYYVDFGKAGMIVEPTLKDITNSLLELLDNDEKRKTLKIEALRNIKKFDWRVLAERLATVYMTAKD